MKDIDTSEQWKLDGDCKMCRKNKYCGKFCSATKVVFIGLQSQSFTLCCWEVLKMKIPKAVMMSIQPEWCDLIVQGKKTVELRKTTPQMNRLYPPFRVYIYCTKILYTPKTHTVADGGQKVIGYFTCKWFDKIFPDGIFEGEDLWCSNPDKNALEGYCLSGDEIKKYLKGKIGLGWHIDNLVIYETPKTLEDFGMKRPPQSWCYVYGKNDFWEELENERNFIQRQTER